MNERIKFLRKHFNLTQDEFASKLDIKRGAVANYEIGRNIPSDAVIALICRVFNVNKEWLLNGGDDLDPFLQAPKSSLDELAEAHALTDEQYVLLQKFISLKPEIRQGILDYVMDVASAVGADHVPVARSAPLEVPEEELHAKLDRQIAMEKTAAAKSEVS